MGKENNKASLSQEKIAAANYVLNFYQEVATLTSYYSQYENVLLEQEIRSGGNADKVPLEEREYLNEICKQIRYYIRVCYIKYRSIVSKVNKGVDDNITKLKDDLVNKLVTPKDKLELFVVEMNGVLIDNVIKDLLQNSSDIINSIFAENDNTTQ